MKRRDGADVPSPKFTSTRQHLFCGQDSASHPLSGLTHTLHDFTTTGTTPIIINNTPRYHLNLKSLLLNSNPSPVPPTSLPIALLPQQKSHLPTKANNIYSVKNVPRNFSSSVSRLKSYHPGGQNRTSHIFQSHHTWS